MDSKRYFITSAVVKNMFFCICTDYRATRNMVIKRYFLTS
jgi:hypothetical protein